MTPIDVLRRWRWTAAYLCFVAAVYLVVQLPVRFA